MDIAAILDNRPNTYWNDFSFRERTGILFIFSGWSGPCRAALSHLLQSLNEFPDIQLYILDNDETATFNYMIEHDILSHGWGETYWLKEGQIISEIKRYNSINLKEFITNNIKLEA